MLRGNQGVNLQIWHLAFLALVEMRVPCKDDTVCMPRLVAVL